MKINKKNKKHGSEIKREVFFKKKIEKVNLRERIILTGELELLGLDTKKLACAHSEAIGERPLETKEVSWFRRRKAVFR